MNDDKRTTAFGLWRYGNDYLLAAFAVRKKPRDMFDEMRTNTVSMPAYYLVGHSIELSLKAFLRGRGIALKILRSRAFGHDLEVLLKESRKRKLGNEVKLNRAEINAILLLNRTYKSKEFEYIVTGSVTLPTYAVISKTADKLSKGLKNICYKKTFNKSLQPTAKSGG